MYANAECYNTPDINVVRNETTVSQPYQLPSVKPGKDSYKGNGFHYVALPRIT